MVRIGLLNIHNVENYGANLIAYSMEREIMRMGLPGAEISTIRFLPEMEVSFRQADSLLNSYRQFGPSGSLRSLKKSARRWWISVSQAVRGSGPVIRIKRVIRKDYGKTKKPADRRAEEQRLRTENFEKFRGSCLHLSGKVTADDMEHPDYDIIVVGSDVVWKPARLLAREENRAYFLLKADRCGKIAYAASIGMSDRKVLTRLKDRYARAIDRFDHISMRERSAQKYVQELLPDRDIAHCIDPVFLRKREEYLDLIGDLSAGEGDYIYVYLMGSNEEAYRFAEKLAEEKKLPVIYHLGNDTGRLKGISSFGDGPREFLLRIYKARYIVTDTFHGTALSMIFRKQFLTFTRGNMSVRLEDFLSGMGLRDRLVESAEDTRIIDRPIDYEAVGSGIEEWAERSGAWLREALEDSVERLKSRDVGENGSTDGSGSCFRKGEHL